MNSHDKETMKKYSPTKTSVAVF